MITCPSCSKQWPSWTSIRIHFRGPCGAPDLETLFWMKVEKGDGCWRWTGHKDKSGYGRFDRKGGLTYAHRVAWIFTNGDIPADKDVLHSCDVRCCCNPEHLFLGTHEENMADAKAKDRHARGERNRWATLTEEQVLEIRREYRCHGRRSNIDELKQKYGVGRTAIYMAATGRTWRHLNRVSPGDVVP